MSNLKNRESMLRIVLKTKGSEILMKNGNSIVERGSAATFIKMCNENGFPELAAEVQRCINGSVNRQLSNGRSLSNEIHDYTQDEKRLAMLGDQDRQAFLSDLESKHQKRYEELLKRLNFRKFEKRLLNE